MNLVGVHRDMGAEDPEVREADAWVLHRGHPRERSTSTQLPDVGRVSEAPSQGGQPFAHLGSSQPLLDNYLLLSLLRSF